MDGLNDSSIRQIGFKRSSWQKGECKDDKWDYTVAEPSTIPSNRAASDATFGSSTDLGETKGGNGAKRLMPEGTDVNEKTLPIEKGRVGDYTPYKFLKYGDTDYNDYLDKLGNVVKNAAKSKKNKSNK